MKTIDLLADLIYPLVIILMETFWIYPWLMWIGRFPVFDQIRSPLSLASVFITLAAATLAVRLFLRPGFRIWLVQIAIVGSGLVVILLILAAEYRGDNAFLSAASISNIGQAFRNADAIVVALPALLYLWWRGTYLGQMTFNFKNIYNTFLVGVVAIILLIIVWQISASTVNGGGPGTNVGYYVLAVFFFGLLAIAISHLYTMRNSMPKEEAGMTSTWRWLPIMLTVIGGMIIVVFVVAGIFSPGFFTSVGNIFTAVWHFITKFLDFLIMPLNWVFEGIIWILRWIIARLRSGDPATDNATDNLTQPELFPDKTPAELPVGLIVALKWIFIIAIIALVIFILAKAVSRYRARHAAEAIEEIHESIFSWDDVGNDLRQLFNSIGKKFQRQRPRVPGGFDEDEKRRLDVREAYRRILWEASRSGLKRRRHETPEEYLRRAENYLPETRESLTDLTDMYIDVRYGEARLPEEKVDQANGLWQILRSIFRGIRGR